MGKRAGFLALIGCSLAACGETRPPLRVQAAAPAARPSPDAPSEAIAARTSEAHLWDPERFRNGVEEGTELLLASNPVMATALGDHRYDSEWPDLSADGEARRVEAFRARAQALRALAAGAPAEADPAAAGTDRPALDARILADRLEYLTYVATALRTAEVDPSHVVGLVGSGVTSLTAHDFAPKRDRMASLAARLEKVPALLDVARARVKKPKRAALENLAIIVQGLAPSLRDEYGHLSVDEAGGDSAISERLGKSATAASAAIEAYGKDIQRRFPAEKADNEPIGAEAWATLARLGEGVEATPAEVRALGEAEIARLGVELDALIAQAEGRPSRDVAELTVKQRAAFFKRLEADPLKAAQILDAYRDANRDVVQWMQNHPFVTVPWDKMKLEVVQTPPQGRGTTLASLNAAGPLEANLSDARFEVNVPDARMPPSRRAALLAFHARGALEVVSIHEAIPGHYLQHLVQAKLTSKVRKITAASTLGEGWAHYCEQAVLDAGYAGADATRTRAFYLRMALQRATRVVVDVGENDGSLSVDDGAKLLEQNAFLAPEAARIEARRAVVRPANMFTYTYGKLAILRLRDAVKAAEGAEFDVRRFHDRLLAVGSIPIRYVGPAAFGIDVR